jgi:hypothetical protein
MGPGGTGPIGMGPVGAGSRSAFDVGKLNRADAFFGGASLLLLISMFFAWYTLNFTAATGSVSGSGSVNGFHGWRYLIFLLALAGIAYVLGKGLGVLPQLPLPAWQVMGVIGVADVVLVILAFLTKPTGSYTSVFGGGYHWSWGFGLILALVMSLVVAGAAYWEKIGAPAVK